MTTLFRTVSFLALVTLWGMLVPCIASAQDLSVRVQPTLIDERLDPGESKSGQFTVTNQSAGIQNFSFTVRNVASVNETGRPVFSDEPPIEGNDISEWITLSKKTVSLKADESATIDYTITIPEGASPGGHVGGIFVDRAADPGSTIGATVGFQVGALLTLHVNGDVTENLQLVQFSSEKLIYTTADANFTVRVKNDGTVIERPRGGITLIDMLGNEVETVSVNTGNGAALPKSERVYQAKWKGTGFHIGRYQAIVTLSYGLDAKSSISREVSFWVIPVKPLLIVLGIALIIALILWGILRLSVKRALTKAGVSQSLRSAPAPKTFGARLASTAVLLLTIMLLGLMVIFVLFA